MVEYVCKPGEMLLKSKPVRRAFANRLIHNMKDAAGQPPDGSGETVIRREQGTFAVQSPDPSIPEKLRHVFGITSIATIHRFESEDIDRIVAEGRRFFEPAVTGKPFAVRCHRSGLTSFRSLDVAAQLGAALHPFSAGVDLTHPEVVCRLDIDDSTVKF